MRLNYFKSKVLSIITICFISTILLPFNSFAANVIVQNNKSQDVQSQNVNSTKIDIDGLSKKYHVNPNELRAAIEKAANSPVFSPFSEIKANLGIEPSISKITPAQAESGYIQVYNQNSTAYLATGYLTASGLIPAVGMCAVHHYSSGSPYIPFGTSIYYDNSVQIQGQNYSIFDVEDTGDPNFVQSAYWTDLFFGANTSANQTAALNYGNNLVGYKWYV